MVCPIPQLVLKKGPLLLTTHIPPLARSGIPVQTYLAVVHHALPHPVNPFLSLVLDSLNCSRGSSRWTCHNVQSLGHFMYR